MLLSLLLTLCAAGALTQGTTRLFQIDIDSALNRDNIVVLTGVRVFRDEIVVLDTYGGVITVGAVNMTVRNSLFDTLNLAHVYSTVDDASGNVAVCTNRKGRCQYIDVSYWNYNMELTTVDSVNRNTRAPYSDVRITGVTSMAKGLTVP